MIGRSKNRISQQIGVIPWYLITSQHMSILHSTVSIIFVRRLTSHNYATGHGRGAGRWDRERPISGWAVLLRHRVASQCGREKRHGTMAISGPIIWVINGNFYRIVMIRWRKTSIGWWITWWLNKQMLLIMKCLFCLRCCWTWCLNKYCIPCLTYTRWSVDV